MLSRRDTLLGALALGACASTSVATDYPSRVDEGQAGFIHGPPERPGFPFFVIEQRIGGRVGVAALNTADGSSLTYRANERFPMCSTFKWVLAAAQLHLAERGGPHPDQELRFDTSDLLDYAPVAREHLARGSMTIREACEAAVKLSDNTAANLLLRGQGGPDALTGFLRTNGDDVTRLDRYETDLNEVGPGDERDTTSPEAMARTLQRFLLEGRVLTPTHRGLLIGWMIESPTGRERLRAGFPRDWRVGDKTGTWNGENNASNDVAIAWPPGRPPIVVASYLHRSTAPPAERNVAHAEIARIVTQHWG